MSEPIKHECGIAFIRLRKNIKYYIKKYQTPAYALNKLYLLMEKQHNRGQNGAGIASIKIDHEPGKQYMHRVRSTRPSSIKDAFEKGTKKLIKIQKLHPEKYTNAAWMKNHVPFIGEVYMGHLRYGTHGKNKPQNCHPMLRRSNWRSRVLVVGGNFNMTNVDELFDLLIRLGQHPREKIDTVTVMEKIGHFLDKENDLLIEQFSNSGYTHQEVRQRVEESIDLRKILRRSCQDFDGGYVIVGMTGYGASFIARDPNGIRPAYYYADDEVVIVASEKPAIKTTFNVAYDKIKEIRRGTALIIEKSGDYKIDRFAKKHRKKPCSFERIYFSRGTDPSIYAERKKLGEILCPQVLEAISYNLEDTVFSYVPNTAEISFLGLVGEMEKYLTQKQIQTIEKVNPKGKDLKKLLSFSLRVEKLVIKDAKLRTFITEERQRDDLVAHVYDTTYEVIQKHKDTLVIVDDSIVRGTTLEKSIIRMLDRLSPKRIIIVSSAPQVKYPDCYGIDMSQMHHFVAFRAMNNLLKKTNREKLKEKVYQQALKSIQKKQMEVPNYVKALYEPFSQEDISEEIAKIIKQKDIKADIKVIYQKVDNLHKACPDHTGDWYFTGSYPTKGGNKVVNKAFVNFMQGISKRAY